MTRSRAGARLRGLSVGLVLPIVGLVGAIGTWWLVSNRSTSFYYPPLADIWEAFVANWLSARAGEDLVPSLTRFFAGFGAACAVGVSLGLVLGISSRLQRAFRPQIEFLRSTPPVLLLPPSLLLFGTGSGMKIFVIALGSMWPILLATISGVRGTDRVALDMAKVFGLPLTARLRRVVMPGTLPAVIAGMRSALPIALVLMVVTELVASTNGVGYFILQSQQEYDVVNMWSGVLLLAIVGMALSLSLGFIERRVHARVLPTSEGARS